MAERRRSGLMAGMVLIVIGLVLLAVQLTPELTGWLNPRYGWPLLIVGLGGLVTIVGFVTWQVGSVTGGCFLLGLGGILYWQNATDSWASWAYIWTLFPGFTGVGMILSCFMADNPRRAFTAGLWSIFTSAMLFLIFGSFLGNLTLLGVYWPVLVIALGAAMLLRPIFKV
jgi:hypothetical protein